MYRSQGPKAPVVGATSALVTSVPQKVRKVAGALLHGCCRVASSAAVSSSHDIPIVADAAFCTKHATLKDELAFPSRLKAIHFA